MTERKTIKQITEDFVPGDELRFAGNWHRIKGVGNDGTDYLHIFFYTYPPVLVRLRDSFEWRRP